MSDIKKRRVAETTTLYSCMDLPYETKDDREAISCAGLTMKKAIIESILRRIDVEGKDVIIAGTSIRYDKTDSHYTMNFRLRASIDCKEVIYCKSCEFYSQEFCFCNYTNRMVNANDYCSRAKKGSPNREVE